MGIGIGWWIALGVVLLLEAAVGVVTMEIAKRKGWTSAAERIGWFLIGFLSVIGIIVALVISPKPTPPQLPPMPG